MNRTRRNAIFFWIVTSVITYITTVSLGMNFYLYDQYKQVSEGCKHIQEKLVKHIETFGDIEDD